MIVILQPDISKDSPEYESLFDHLKQLPNIQLRIHEEHGTQQVLTEIYLVGDTAALAKEEIEALPGVERVVRISQEYRILGRHKDEIGRASCRERV